MSTRVVHCKKESYDVLIDRTTKWGNPFKIGDSINGSIHLLTRDDVIEAYERWIRTIPYLLESLPELEGKTLGCWCKPERCHGDVLVKLIEETHKGDG